MSLSPPCSPNHVGIVTRTRDNALLLWRAMESVLDQSHTGWTHVIVNDGGNREPVDRLAQRYRERYRDRLIVLHLEKSAGPEAGFNRAIAALNCAYVAVHDDDDSWDRLFLEKSIATLATQKELIPKMRGMMSWCTYVTEHLDGEKIVEDTSWPHNDYVSGVKLYELLARDFMPAICFLFECDALNDLGSFDETLPRFGFREFVLRFLTRYEIGVLPKCLAQYRQCSGASLAHGQTLYPHANSYPLYEAQFRNEMLRRDMAAGKPGLGFLLSLATDSENLRTQQRQQENIAWQTQNLIKMQALPNTPQSLRKLILSWLCRYVMPR